MNLEPSLIDFEPGCDTPDVAPPIESKDLPPPGTMSPEPVIREDELQRLKQLRSQIRARRQPKAQPGFMFKAIQPIIPNDLEVHANNPIVPDDLGVHANNPIVPSGLGITQSPNLPQPFVTACEVAVCPNPPPGPTPPPTPSLNMPICGAPEKPLLDVNTWLHSLVPDIGVVLQEVLDELWSAWITVQRVSACSKRIQAQWFFEDRYENASTSPVNFYPVVLSDEFDINELCIFPLERMANAICMAGARLTNGYYNLIAKPKAVFTYGGSCNDGLTVFDVENPGDGEIRICDPWIVKTKEERKIELITALSKLSKDDTYDARWIAEWIIARHAEHGDTQSTGFTDWDKRPDCSRLPMLALMHTYSWVTTHPSDTDKLRRAWDESWKWVEAAWRRLYRMQLLYMEAAEAGHQDEADDMIRQLWEYGGRHMELSDTVPGSPYWGLPYPNEGLEMCLNKNDVCREPDKFTYNASLQSWFGAYSRENFITVCWVINALVSRYQGDFYISLMSNVMWRTKFHVLTWGARALSYPTGEIWLKNDFRNTTSDSLRARTICHEMMHYLVRWDAGGRPRDIYNPACTQGQDNNKCYGDSDSLKLAAAGDAERIKNLSNYEGWIFWHYKRWCGDWPPELDREPGDTWHEDPISSAEWITEAGNHRLSWVPLLEIRNRMLGSDWKPF